jgi:hypothetical protein
VSAPPTGKKVFFKVVTKMIAWVATTKRTFYIDPPFSAMRMPFCTVFYRMILI